MGRNNLSTSTNTDVVMKFRSCNKVIKKSGGVNDKNRTGGREKLSRFSEFL